MFNPENLPVLIDICSGGGLAAKGLRRAGFFTIGIDHKRKHYAGNEFIQMDVIQFLNLFLKGKILQGVNVSAFWGSVPCQGYSNKTVGQHPAHLRVMLAVSLLSARSEMSLKLVSPNP